MLILLGISTALAVVTPGQRESDPPEETAATGSTGATGENEPDDEPARDPNLAVKTVRAAGKGDPPPVATAEAAGRLVLTVETSAPAVVSIPRFGRTASATEYAPAVFDLVMPVEADTFEVIDLESGDTLAEIKTKG